MAFSGNMLWALLALPALGSLVCLVLPSPRAVLNTVAWGVEAIAACAAGAVAAVAGGGPLAAAGEWLWLDALSSYHLFVMMLVFSLSSVYARLYFRHEPAGHELTLSQARRFGALWYGALTAMTLVLLSNNLGIMWVGVEATTLLTAFLICLHVSAVSLEATWKYLIVCSVGVAFAFMGTLLVGAAAVGAESGSAHCLHWTHVRAMAESLDPRLIKLAFIFLLVGYGTKVGLAPLHSWLPDAHSQAPAPVSALFSGFLLNTALYCVMRFLPIVEAATGQSGWARGLLVFFGLFSVLIAAVFILSQRDLKRLLAYCSVEHMGIIALGLGLGPLGVFAALFHTLNHSLSKTLAFFAAGRVGQMTGTHDMRSIRGMARAHPLWGTALLGSLLALIGVAPFSVFLSEWFLVKAAAEARATVALAVFLLGAGIVFVAMLQRAIDMAWGPSEDRGPTPRRYDVGELAVVLIPFALLLLLGVWMPPVFRQALEEASRVVTGGPP